MFSLVETLEKIWATSGFANITWQQLLMIAISGVLIYLAIVKKFEPLLLLPIAFGMLLANLPLADLMVEEVAGSSARWLAAICIWE